MEFDRDDFVPVIVAVSATFAGAVAILHTDAHRRHQRHQRHQSHLDRRYARSRREPGSPTARSIYRLCSPADTFISCLFLRCPSNLVRPRARAPTRRPPNMTIRKVAIFGAASNFGAPITAALQRAGFTMTIITRPESTSTFPPDIPVIRTEYTRENLTSALTGQDAAVCVVGPAGVGAQSTMVDAAEAAGVKRFIVNDFGWGPDTKSFPEFDAIHAHRRAGWDHAKARAEENRAFTWTGISTGNPIDWAMKRFPAMGFNISTNSAIIYDAGTEKFTGTTLDGIGQSVVGVLQNPTQTANRFVKVRSIMTCQNELLDAFQSATGTKWEAERGSTQALVESGKRKFADGIGGWVLDLVVAQLFDVGEARCVVAQSREESDCDLLGVIEESPQQVVEKVLGLNLG